jgi:hypothetical protein
MRSLHRSLGALIAIFVIILAATGILLNHSSQLNLDEEYLTWPWLLEHYGVASVEADVVFLLENKAISQFGQQIFVDSTPVTMSPLPLLGGLKLDDIMVLATSDGLILLTSEGEFVERMTSAVGIPSQIQNIGLFHGDPVLQTRDGMFRSDYMLDSWEAISLQGVSWSAPQPMPTSVEKSLAAYFHGKGISIERFVLDIHNGRILDEFGVWLLDALAIIMIVLSFTGIVIWLRRF